jgi:uncharacterized protein YkwD
MTTSGPDGTYALVSPNGMDVTTVTALLVLAPEAACEDWSVGPAGDGNCRDSYTGLCQRTALVAPTGSTAISPLSQLPVELVDLQAAGSTTVENRSAFALQQLAMSLVSSATLADVSLLSYNPYAVLDDDTVRDDGVASPLQARTMQVHAVVLQLAVVLAELAVTPRRRLHVAGGPEAAAPMRRQLQGETTAAMETVLNLLNNKRALHCASDLAWSESLASEAQTYANLCPSDFSDGSIALYGETLAFGKADGPTGASEAVEAWYAESANYKTEYYGSEPNMDELKAGWAESVWGQFTQVVWSGSKEVGCAYNGKCGAKPTVWVCRFSPRGNRDSFATNVLETCPLSPPASPPPSTRASAESVVAMGHVAYRTLAQQLRVETLPVAVRGEAGLTTLLETAAAESSVLSQYAELSDAKKVALVTAMQNSYELIENQFDPTHGVLQLWQLEVLDELNLKRAPHCSPNLVWDAALAEGAQTFISASCDAPPAHSDGFNASKAKSLGIEGYGETLAAGVAANRVNSAVFSWYYNLRGKYTGVYEEEVADYMQVMWAAYDRIGCAQVTCASEWRVVCRYQSSAGGEVADLSDADAVRTNVRAEAQPVCESNPTPSRRQLSRNAASEAAFVASGHVVKQVALLAAGAITASDLAARTDAATLATLAANAGIPLTTYLISPSPPPAPPPGKGVSEGASNQTTQAELVMSIVFPLFFFFVLLVGVPLCCFRWTGGNVGLFVKLLTTHSNPNMIMRYLPRDARELIRLQLAADRAEMGLRINGYSNPMYGWMHMAFDKGHLKRKQQDEEAKDAALLDDSVENDTRPLGVPIDTPAGLPPTQDAQTPRLLTGEVPTAGAAAQLAPQREGDYSEYSDAGGNAAMVDESEQDRQRRIEWIKYYVRTGEPDKAYELGWDGLPFQIAVAGAQTDLTRI